MEKNRDGAAVVKTSDGAAQAPYSTGTGRAQLIAPKNACDCHLHIFDMRVPSTPPSRARADASVADYRLLQKRIGTSRNVIVTASNYAYNNDATVAALEQFGSSARGIAVVDTGVTDIELKRLHDKGIRGIRVTKMPVTPWDDVGILAKRVAPLSWHMQFNLEIADVVAHESLLSGLPIDLVFDHMARVEDVNDPALKVIMRLIDKGKTWIKLSGAYLIDPQGAPKYARAVELGKAYVDAAPERIVWGSDWPHPSAAIKPDDAVVFDLNKEWAPTEALREQILVRNPESLYGFEKTQ